MTRALVLRQAVALAQESCNGILKEGQSLLLTGLHNNAPHGVATNQTDLRCSERYIYLVVLVCPYPP